MYSRILTSHIVEISDFMHAPHNVLNHAKDGIVAITTDNVPDFYAISTQRLSQLLRLEAYFMRHEHNIKQNNYLYKERLLHSESRPIGKFSMYPGWNPDVDLLKMAALWGIFLTKPVTSEEIDKFITYWKKIDKELYHIQWQKKLARSVQIIRTENILQHKINPNIIFNSKNQIPPGFRG